MTSASLRGTHNANSRMNSSIIARFAVQIEAHSQFFFSLIRWAMRPKGKSQVHFSSTTRTHKSLTLTLTLSSLSNSLLLLTTVPYRECVIFGSDILFSARCWSITLLRAVIASYVACYSYSGVTQYAIKNCTSPTSQHLMLFRVYFGNLQWPAVQG